MADKPTIATAGQPILVDGKVVDSIKYGPGWRVSWKVPAVLHGAYTVRAVGETGYKKEVKPATIKID